MFEVFFWSSFVEAISKLPKEIVTGAVAAFVIIDIHKRNTDVKIAEANAKVRSAELEVEALKLKQQLQQNDPKPTTP